MYPLRSRPALAFMFLIALCAALMPPVTAACTEPNVDFTFNTGTPPIGPPFPVSFTDRTVIPAGTSVTGITWNFGDGETSSKKNPVHSYATKGTYTVGLRVTSSCGAPKIKTKTVSVDCSMWDVGFSVDKTEGPAPLTVHVTDTSLNTSDATTQWTYTFEPGITSSERNPTYTFKNPGTYWMVQYIVKNCGQADRNVMTGKTITVNPALTVYSVTNLSMPNVTSPTTTVTTTVTPTVTTTTTWSEPVVPVYVDTRATGFVPGTTAPTAPQIASATQQGAASPAPSLAPRTPGTGTLSVATNPPGAQVFVDDVLRGLSPANIPALPAGQHTLRLEKSGYRNMTVPVSIEEGKTTDYSTGLEAESGGMGIVPIIVGVLVIAAIGGGAYWYMRKKGPGTGGQT